jgi:hypothetical protein
LAQGALSPLHTQSLLDVDIQTFFLLLMIVCLVPQGIF